jgi:hypothetical protein
VGFAVSHFSGGYRRRLQGMEPRRIEARAVRVKGDGCVPPAGPADVWGQTVSGVGGGGVLGLCGAEFVKGGVSVKDYGQMIWSNDMIKRYGQTMWSYNMLNCYGQTIWSKSGVCVYQVRG